MSSERLTVKSRALVFYCKPGGRTIRQAIRLVEPSVVFHMLYNLFQLAQSRNLHAGFLQAVADRFRQ